MFVKNKANNYLKSLTTSVHLFYKILQTHCRFKNKIPALFF